MCEQQENKPHVHAALIKAWADGAIIEYRSLSSGGWSDTTNPGWYPHYEYRIQPHKKSPGQIVEEAYYKVYNMKSFWDNSSSDVRKAWEVSAQAVIDSLNQK